ncbi:MAG: S8 family serine peptidase, partial [SAR202 cluster bacterium]|nr:S8 family serine peptidase [SAR202 cluster bacterium]
LMLVIGITASNTVVAGGQEDSIYVMLELNVPFTSEADLKDQKAVYEQRKAIREAGNRVVKYLDGYRFRVTAELEMIPYIGLSVTKAAYSALELSKDVVRVVEEERYYPHLNNSIPQVQADVAQAVGGVNGTGFAVAILDTGVASGHEFLAGKVVAEACFTDFNCPNGGSVQFGPGSGAPCPQGGCDHGTHVAGIAAGFNTSWQAGEPRRGVASGADIIAVQIFNFDEISRNIFAMPHNWALALRFVYDLHTQNPEVNVAAVNMSLGIGNNSTACDADPLRPFVDTLRAAGVATVASSGNSSFTNGMETPACISSVVSVGSVDQNDNVAPSSNSAPFLDLLAPGIDVLGGLGINSSVPGGGYGQKSGTSMAAPHVAGAFAILREANPAASVDFLLDSLTTTGVLVTDPKNTLTHPRISIFTALGGPVPPAGTPTCDGLTATIWGDNGPNGLLGTAGADVIVGMGGDDVIDGRGGDDVICAGPGQDTVFGGTGDDRIFGESGWDHIFGQANEDWLEGGDGNDYIEGGADDDRLIGDAGVDTLHGQDGDDIISGNAQGDFIYGGRGQDTLNGNGGNDMIFGQRHDDTLICGGGVDTADGGLGVDTATADCEFTPAVP